MIDWFHAQPRGWMAVAVFGSTFLVAAAIQWLIQRLAVGERARTFKGVSTGLLSPLGIIFGLMVAFLAAQVYTRVHREGPLAGSTVARLYRGGEDAEPSQEPSRPLLDP